MGNWSRYRSKLLEIKVGSEIKVVCHYVNLIMGNGSQIFTLIFRNQTIFLNESILNQMSYLKYNYVNMALCCLPFRTFNKC